MPFDLDRAWERLAEMIGWIVALFGAPGDIAQRIAFMRKDRQHFLHWLAPLEAFARRLLFIEAAALAPANAPAPFHARGRIARAYRDAPAPVLAEDAAAWRVVFRVGGASGPPPSRRHGREGGCEAASPRDRLANAVPLARRLEALLRLAQDRAAAVRRLARRLHAEPARTAAAFAPYRHRATHCADALAEAQAHVDDLRGGPGFVLPDSA